MNIRYIQSNIRQIPQDNLIKFLYDLLFQEISDIENYQEGVIYNKGDRVYLQENNKHQIFQCIVNSSSTIFIDSEWVYIMEVFEGEVSKYRNLVIKEEVHHINESNMNGVFTKLIPTSKNFSYAMYCGKNRYAINYDYTVIDNYISFNKPFNIGDRIILELRELIGTTVIGIILYDLNAKPYKVFIDGDRVINIEPHDVKNENDIKYGELATGDRTYTLLVDGGSEPYELKAYRKVETYITSTSNNIYKIVATEDKLNFAKCDRNNACYSDTKVILGLDKKFYTLDIVNNEIKATEYIDDSLDIHNYDVGVKIITENFKNRLICIDNGKISLMPYIENGGYHYINFIDHDTGKLVRFGIDDDNEFVLNDGLATDGYSGTRLLDNFYFFDDDWNYNRMFVKNGDLLFEPCGFEVIPDSRGINMMRRDGELVKIVFDNNEHVIYDAKYLNMDNLGTFASPIEGFVVKIGDETKLITVNKMNNGFELVNTTLPFRTNHHYIMSKDNELYKLEFDNDIRFVKVDKNDYNIDIVNIGAFIQSNEMIVRFDIIDGEYVFNPISTLVHRIKAADGNSYVVDVCGDPYEEVLCFTHIDNVKFDKDVSSGYLYLKDEENNCYVVDIDKNGNLDFVVNEPVDDVDYSITSLIESSQGWYNIILRDNNIILEKIFDNIYDSALCYGNIIKKSFNMHGLNGKLYGLSANGLGEIIVNEVDKNSISDITGLVLRSDDGYNYGLGVYAGRFITYRSFISNPKVVDELIIKDSTNNNIHSLFMTGSRLCSKLSNSNDYNLSLIMYDVYRNEFKIEIEDNKLKISSL